VGYFERFARALSEAKGAEQAKKGEHPSPALPYSLRLARKGAKRGQGRGWVLPSQSEPSKKAKKRYHQSTKKTFPKTPKKVVK